MNEMVFVLVILLGLIMDVNMGCLGNLYPDTKHSLTSTKSEMNLG